MKWQAAPFVFMLCSAEVFACPTSDDLDRGVVIEHEARNRQGEYHPRQTYLRRTEPNVLAFVEHPQLGNDPWRNHDLGGVLALDSARRSGALAATGTFAPDVTALFPLGPDETHTFEGTWASDRGVWASVYTITTGAEQTVTLGECPYRAVEFEMTDVRTLPDGSVRTTSDQGLYIPDLMWLHAPTDRFRTLSIRPATWTERFFWPFGSR